MGLLINGQVGWRAATVIAPSTPSLWTSVYAVYNADATGSSSLKTSLYAAYNGESNANDSFGSNNGTAVGGLTYTTGKIGNAFNLNGTNAYVDMGDVMDVGTSSWSYSFWFKTNDAVNAGICFSKSFSGNASGRFWGGYYNNRFAWNFQADTNVIYTETNNGSIVNNTWYHVVCVIDRNSNLKVYINGSLQTLNVTSGTNNLTPYVSYNFNTNHPFRIGAYTAADNTTANTLVNGQIDAFNVWNRVLTQSEITELYNSGNGAQYITDNFYKPTPNDALNTYNGTAQGGLTYGVGKVGTAFQFNGTNSYVSLPNNSLNFTGDFSYSFWVKMSNVVGSSVDSFIENLSLGSTYAYGYNFLRETASWRFDIRSGGGLVIYRYSSGGFTNGQWYHVVLSRTNNNSPKLYINNTLAPWLSITPLGTVPTPVTTLNPVYQSNQSCSIGGAIIGFLNGSIDGLSVWNKELTQSEITELYNSGNGKQYPN